MSQHLTTTAGTIRCRIVSLHGQTSIMRMALTPLPLVARLGPTFFTGSRTWPGWRRAARPITGGRLGRVAAVLVEAVLQLGDAVQEFIDQLVGLLEGQWWHCRCRLFFGHANEDATRAGSCNRQRRIKRRSSPFSCQVTLGERLHLIGRVILALLPFGFSLASLFIHIGRFIQLS